MFGINSIPHYVQYVLLATNNQFTSHHNYRFHRKQWPTQHIATHKVQNTQ